MAVVVSAGSKLQDVPLAELTKLCKGAQKTWPDGRSFTLILKDPESHEMRIVAKAVRHRAGRAEGGNCQAERDAANGQDRGG